jgi:hypothetical protein
MQRFDNFKQLRRVCPYFGSPILLWHITTVLRFLRHEGTPPHPTTGPTLVVTINVVQYLYALGSV